MAGNFIFGSGIVGLVAKEILAGPWEIVPFRSSRFYSFGTPLADNFIVRDDGIDDLISDLGGRIASAFYRRAYSYRGQLLSTFDEDICRLWLQKVFGDLMPSQAIPYWSRRMVSPIYDLRINKVYESLMSKHLPLLKNEAGKGEVTEVGDHYFIRSGVRVEFDNLLSTIPLNNLLTLVGWSHDLKSLPLHYVHVASSSIDLEGHNQAMVADYLIDFFKVTCLKPNHYLFYSVREMVNPGAYLLPIIGVADIIDGTMISEAVPAGEISDQSSLERFGIYNIGAMAQWDWCMDVSSCFLRLLRYGQRGYKPKQ